MIQYENIQKAHGIDITISKPMAEEMLLWSRMYLNRAPWLTEEVKSLNLPAAICTEMARLTTMELQYSITGGGLAVFLAEQFKKVYTDLSRYIEYGCSTGGLVLKPYLESGRIAVDYVQAGNFFPTDFDSSGGITGCVFPEFKQAGKKLYTRLEYHKYLQDVYSIVNKAFVSNTTAVTIDNIFNLGNEIPLDEVEAWSSLEPYVEFYHATGPLPGCRKWQSNYQLFWKRRKIMRYSKSTEPRKPINNKDLRRLVIYSYIVVGMRIRTAIL